MAHSTLLNSLAGYWPCTETSGTRVDVSGNGNDLAQTGAISRTNFQPSFNTSFQLSGAAVYDGNLSNFLCVADNTKLRMGNTDYTIACWCYFNTSPGTAFIAGKGANETNGFEYLMVTFNRGFGFNAYPFGTSVPLISALAPWSTGRTSGYIETGKWYLVIGRKKTDGPTEVRVNNNDWGRPSLGASLSFTGGGYASSVAKFAIGTRVLSSGIAEQAPISGNLCNVGVWSRLLNDAECGELWQGGFGRTYDFRYPDLEHT